MSNDDRELVRLDPESESCIELMIEVVAEEIDARVAVGDADLRDPTWASRVALHAVDAVLDNFRVRRRLESEPRYRWDMNVG